MLIQRDTYFRAASGRLKLREEEAAAAHLIAYDRIDRAEQRESRYRIATVENPDEIKAVLGAALGIDVVVVKRRRLFIWEGVRIHLDRVEGLGRFVELEAIVDGEGSEARAEARLESLREALGIDDRDLIGSSYCDLTRDESGNSLDHA